MFKYMRLYKFGCVQSVIRENSLKIIIDKICKSK